MAEDICAQLNAGQDRWARYVEARGPYDDHIVAILDTMEWEYTIARCTEFDPDALVAAYISCLSAEQAFGHIAEDLIGLRSGKHQFDRDFTLSQASQSSTCWCIGRAQDLKSVGHVQAHRTHDDGWNGRCQSCGGRTYTGLLNVQHEGGSCGG